MTFGARGWDEAANHHPQDSALESSTAMRKPSTPTPTSPTPTPAIPAYQQLGKLPLRVLDHHTWQQFTPPCRDLTLKIRLQVIPFFVVS